MRFTIRQGGIVAVLAALVAVGCASPTDELKTADPTPVVTSSPSSRAYDEADVTEWIAFRTRYGLRSDRPYILSVAADPASTNDTGIPLTPGELAALGSLNVAQADLIAAIKEYGGSRARAYAGMVVDGSTVVLQVAGPVAPHVAALKAILGRTDGWEVREVRWTLTELQGFADTVEASRPWFEGRDMLVPGPAVDEGLNAVLVDYFARDRAVGEQLAQHLGDPAWLEMRYGGPPPFTGARGRLEVKVVDGHGRPIEGLYCQAFPVDPTVNADTGESFSTNSKGICSQLHLPGATYRIVVNRLKDGEPIPIGKGRATVRADTTSRITIFVQD